MDNINPNYFVIIPSHLLDDPRIDDSTALLFGRISSLSNNHGYCFASDKYLAELTGVTDREIKNRLKTLEDCGYIKRETKKNGMFWDRKIFPNFNYEGITRSPRREHTFSSEGHICSQEQDKREINKKDSSPNSPPASSALSEDAFGLVDFLHSKIKEQDPKAKPPDRHKWATTIDRMHRLDGYSWDEIRALIEFAHNDPFWMTNILSADKLRKQATQLTARMKQADRKSPAQQSFERSETNRKLADNLYLQIKEPYRRLRVFDTGCQVKVGGKWISLRYSENGFKEQLDSLIRKSENR